MFQIIAHVLTLFQYNQLNLSDNSALSRPEKCSNCGKSFPWFHGTTPRKPDRGLGSKGALNPILLQRYFCSACHKTTSMLPECIPPRRWYLWSIQEGVLKLFLLGYSYQQIAKELGLSRHTVSRWMARLQLRYRWHRDALCTHFPCLSLNCDFHSFWTACLENHNLGKVMRLCHVSQVFIP
jgi:transposase-like protein